MALTIPNTDTAESIAWPSLDDTALARVVVDYDARTDYLYIFLAEKPVRAVWDLRADNNAYVGLRLIGNDVWTNEAVGIMIEHFSLVTRHEHPRWARVLTEIGDERSIALSELIADVAAMPASSDGPDGIAIDP